MREHAKAAHKFATRWYANERGKPDGLSAALISEKVKKDWDGVGPSERTIQREVVKSHIGTSPPKRGKRSERLSDWSFKTFTAAHNRSNPGYI